MISSYITKLQSNTIEDLVLSTPPSQERAEVLNEFLIALSANTSLRTVFFFDINPSSYFDVILQNLASHTRLTSLRILGPGQPFDLLHLLQLLQNNLQLQLLVLQSCSIGDDEVKSIVEALFHHQRLTSVNLSKNHITDLGSKHLIDFLTGKPSITSIDLSFNHQVDNTAVAHWARLLRQSTTLNNLNLNNNNLGNKAFELLGEALASNAYLKTIGLCDIGGDYGDNDISTFLHALGTNSSLTSLDLSYNKLRQDDIVLLSETLRANKTLTELNLAGTSLDDKDIKVLTDGLKFNRTLHVLNLDSNNFAGEGLQALALFLRSRWCSLKSLSLAEIQDAEINEGIGNLATALRTNTSLTFLKINNDKCDFKQFSALMDALRTNTTLLTLDISNFVSLAQKDEILLVAESLAENKTLTDINLDTTGINDAGVGLLCSVARDHCSLRHISLHYNMITEAGAKLLLLTMRLNSRLSFEGIVMNPYIDGEFRKEYQEIHHCFKSKKHALTNPHFTPFHYAAKKGIGSAFRYLFGKADNPNMTCTYGLSLVDYAGIYGHAAILNLLLSFGAYTRDAILLGVDRTQIASTARLDNALFTLDELCQQIDAVLQRPVTTATRLKMIKWHRAGSLLLSLWQRCKLSPTLNEICTRHAIYELGKRLKSNAMMPSLQQRYQFYYTQAGGLIVKRYFDGQLPAQVQARLTPQFAVLLMNKWNQSHLASIDVARHFEAAYQSFVFHTWWIRQIPAPFNETIEAKVIAAIISLAQRMNEAPQFLRQIMQQRSAALPPGSSSEVIAGAVLTELRTRYRDAQLTVEERALFEREVLYPIFQATAGLNEVLLEMRVHAVSHVISVALQQPQAHAALILALVQELDGEVVQISHLPFAEAVAELIHEQALLLMLKDWRFNKFTARESQVMQESTLPQLSSRVVQLRRKIFPSLIDLTVQYLRFINVEEEQTSAREILIQSLDKVHNIDDLARVLNAHPDYEGILSDEVKDEIQKQLNFSQQLNSHPLVKQLVRENIELKKRLDGNKMMRIDSMDSMSERVEEMTDANF